MFFLCISSYSYFYLSFYPSSLSRQWVSEVDKTAGQHTKIQDPQQFAKQSDNPKEFKTKAKAVSRP